ncbi:MAG: cobalt-precorrin-5B (C(1))-methyltransferase CbiD [Clostridiales bacterium]|nr:cobalt-precorrin-5B (C(1))-methyltransferase CbiD [Clostridiales bacterium]MCF8022745.1 cobalt-precorrin-5B (C(1))-methyltransferase CbiD [Clostridiales bacterium]
MVYDKSGKFELRSGYTTGSCAAAAARAALTVLLEGRKLDKVDINIPGGSTLTLPVKKVVCQAGEAEASIVKDAGDDPDVTNNMEITARVTLKEGDLSIYGGKGVGTVTRPGLSVPLGEPAINPVPRAMIKYEAVQLLGEKKGASITIEAQGGEQLAEKTLNPKLGIKNGISILGTTGIVKPMSDDAYIRSLVPQIDQVIALGYRFGVLTPGRMGRNKAESLGFYPETVMETSNYIGEMLEQSARKGFEGVILFGHLGKLLKVAAGIFLTHSRLADARRETLAAHAAVLGAEKELVKKIMQLNTAEESVQLLKERGMEEVYNSIASAASRRAVQYCSNSIKVGTILYAFSGGVIGFDKGAVEIGSELGWQKV